MSILEPSKLETASYGTQGWNAIYSSNFQKLNDELYQKITWQKPVKDRNLSTPPSGPLLNDRYIVSATPTPTGTWMNKENQIAHWTGTAWTFLPPHAGTTVYLLDENVAVTFAGNAWGSVDAIIKTAIIEADLKHTGTKAGFFGIAPRARTAMYMITNPVDRRAIDPQQVTLQDLAETLGTLIQDLKNYGLLQ